MLSRKTLREFILLLSYCFIWGGWFEIKNKTCEDLMKGHLNFAYFCGGRNWIKGIIFKKIKWYLEKINKCVFSRAKFNFYFDWVIQARILNFWWKKFSLNFNDFFSENYESLSYSQFQINRRRKENWDILIYFWKLFPWRIDFW